MTNDNVSVIASQRTNLIKYDLLLKNKPSAYPSQITRTTHTIHEASHGSSARKESWDGSNKKKQRKLRAQNIVYLIMKTRQSKITKLGNTNQHKATQMILNVKD